MRLIRTIILMFLLAGLPVGFCRAEAGAGPGAGAPAVRQAAPAVEATSKVEESLSAGASEVFKIGAFPVTNSMLVTWIVALGVIVGAQLATRKMKLVPEGAQNFWEFLVESLYGFIESILGAGLTKKTFWFFLTIFIFILFTNWVGLIPGVGTILVRTDEGMEPLFRGGNADLNMTFAMAAIFMVLWLFWALRSNGIWGFALHLFGPKGESSGFIKYMMIVIFFFVGFLEVISIAFRPISLSFRLYGNIFAGENLLEAMSNLVQHPAWAKTLVSIILPVPFYFLEILVGMVQAFVFMLLTIVYTALICLHEEEEGKAHH
jgi:F-type H+-transporting ATPase subunit a